MDVELKVMRSKIIQLGHQMYNLGKSGDVKFTEAEITALIHEKLNEKEVG